MMRAPSFREAGFTLIELLMVMVIVAVLAAVAYPAYTGHIARSHRADARAELLRMQMAVEKQRLSMLGAKPALPAAWASPPALGKYYQFSLQSGADQGYTLVARALPDSGQSNDRQGDVSCATLSVRVQGLEAQHEPAACWQ